MNLFSRLMQADPDAVAAAPVGEVDKPSMDDTISALFDKMESEGKTDDAGTLVDTDAPVETDGAKPGKARDATGKFAKSDDTAAAGDVSTDTAKAVGAEVKTEPAVAVASKFADPPKSWNAQEKADWASTPENARAAAHRREENFFKGIEQYKDKASTFDQLDAIIRPHAEIFKASGQNAVENIGGLLNLQQVLYTGSDDQKIGTLLQIAQTAGIKPEVLLQGLQNPPAQPALDPRYDTLARETQQLRAMLSQVQAAPVQSEVNMFLADPKNEHLSEPGLTDSMIGLINSGVAKDVKDAYDKACRLSDSVQAKVAAGKAEAERKAQAERDATEAKRKADLAAKATRASSINVRPRGATAGPAAKGTMEDTAGAIWDRIHGTN